MDHRALLQKYMGYVLIEEGTNYIRGGLGVGDPKWNASEVRFTQEEWDELVRLDAENGKSRYDD